MPENIVFVMTLTDCSKIIKPVSENPYFIKEQSKKIIKNIFKNTLPILIRFYFITIVSVFPIWVKEYM